MMLELYVVNLDIEMLLDHFKEDHLRHLLGVGRYGWTRSGAQEMKRVSAVVSITVGKIMIAAIMKTPE